MTPNRWPLPGVLGIMKRISRLTLAACVPVGLTLALTACGGSPASSAAGSAPARASGSAVASASPGPVSSATPAPATSAPATSGPAPVASSPSAVPPASSLPGVVADCTTSPTRLSRRPASIVQACADGGIGVERMIWSSWTASSATGRGTFWENLCKPNCATGTIATYPVTVTLSAARTSSHGQWFSLMTVAWKANRPPNQTPNRLPLPTP